VAAALNHEALARAPFLTGRCFAALMITTLDSRAVPRKPIVCADPVRAEPLPGTGAVWSRPTPLPALAATEVVCRRDDNPAEPPSGAANLPQWRGARPATLGPAHGSVVDP